MTTEALLQLSKPHLALRPLQPCQGEAVQELALDQLPMAVGAGPTCGIRLSAPGAHPVHCLIVSTPEGPTVRRWAADTQLNGQDFTESLLSVGDRLTCGTAAFEVVKVDSPAAGPLEQPESVPLNFAVAWPTTNLEPIDAASNKTGGSTPDQIEQSSIEQTSELLRMAENCQQLEDELAETRALLTTLGEELLQAREAAAQQASKLLNRIDQLEEDLAERDNLLALLQEALEQRAESLLSDRDPHTAADFDTESTTGTPTSLIVEPSASGEPEREQTSDPSEDGGPHAFTASGLEDCEDGPSSTEELHEEDSTAETYWPAPQSDTPGSGSSESVRLELDSTEVDNSTPTSSEESSLAWGALPAEPETSLSESSEGQGASPTPPLSHSEVSAPSEDLWDIERSSEGAVASLWGEASPAPGSSRSLPAEDIASTGIDSEGLTQPQQEIADDPAADSLDSAQSQPVEPPSDPWGEASLWSTAEEPSHAADDDDIDESALLWGELTESRGQSGANSDAPVDETFPAAFDSESWSTPSQEAESAAGALGSDPHEGLANYHEAPIAPTPVAGMNFHETAGPEQTLGGQSDPLAPEVLEPSQPKPVAPVSYIEKFRHLLDDDGGDDTGRVAEPTPAPPAAPVPQPATSDADDDSIEAYMAKMMARLRGESASEAPTPKVEPQPEIEVAAAETPAPPAPKPSPLLSLDELKTAAAPERHTNMSALRDLANNSARHAIGMANSRRLVHHARTNLILAGVAASAGAYLVWSAPGLSSLEMAGGILGVGGASLWGCRTLSLLAKARRESLGKKTPEEESYTPSDDQLLPIDVNTTSAAR